ncbi:hypothetical protein GGD41_005423 [Paraburkholderia bryophila]|uniref:Cytochrome c oxidase assembly protein subunit 15 n=1 Tax=Paraburkholderia bryophila TaxID=420952 RepID=A0A7Y9WD73_9BURK|nr:hypothetical protein [Paraburkholderia bryophila]
MFVLQLALIGLCIALLPLSYVWVKADDNKFRKLVWLTTFLTLDLVMFGGFTRLTDSGLGCPDWPGCYGTSSPFIAHAAISAAHQLMPTGPVSLTKAWIEMIHRYFAMAIGVLIIAQTIIAWTARIKRRPLHVSPWWPTSLLLLILVQGAFGAWTVTMKLQPIIVTTHLLLGLALLGTLGWLAARQTPLPAYEPEAARWRVAALAGPRAAGRADRVGRLGQHQLRGARLYRLPDLQRPMGSADGLRARFPPVARARHDRRRRDDHAGRAGGDPLDAPHVCDRGGRVSGLVCVETAPFRVAPAAGEWRAAGGADPVHHRLVEHRSAMAVAHCSGA